MLYPIPYVSRMASVGVSSSILPFIYSIISVCFYGVLQNYDNNL